MNTPASSQIIWHEQNLESIRESHESLRRAILFLDLVRDTPNPPLGAERDARQYVEDAARKLLHSTL